MGVVRLSTAFLLMAEDARLHRRPAPVIEMDLFSARFLTELVERCMGAPAGSLLSRDKDKNDYVFMLDGIKIVARRPEICKPAVDGWREHFGALAEIWEA